MAYVLCCLTFLGLVKDPTVHDLPDGIVKIATQVVVQPDNTQVKYDVGFNPQTLDQLIEAYAPELDKDASANEKLEAFRKGFKAKIEETLKLKAGGKALKAIDVAYESDEVAKHVQARFVLNYEVLVADETKIEIHDSCFQEMGRIWNSGFKASLPIAIKECSTKAIPLRSRPKEKEAGEADPFVITGTVVKLNINVDSEATASRAPLFVMLFALGSAGLCGLLLVPNETGGDDHHDHH